MTERRTKRVHADLRIAENVRAAVARKRLTRSAVADAAGLTPEQFNRRYNGDTPFEASVVLMLADALDVPAGELLAINGTEVTALSP